MSQRSARFPELFKKTGSTVWWCYLPNPAGGRQLRETTGHRDERAAHGWYLARVRLPSGAEQAEDKKERTLEAALVARLEWLKSARLLDDPTRKKLSADTIDFYRKKGKPLVRILGPDTLLSAISHQQIREYIVARTKETAVGSTIGKELTTLSMAMRLARKDGVSCEVFKDIKPEGFVAVYVARERWCTEDQIDMLIDDLPPNRAAVVAFIIATSATYPSEVVPVRRTMVDTKSFEVHIPGKKREARKRTLRVPSHARRFLAFAMKHANAGTGPLFDPWTNVRRDLHAAAERLSTCKPCREAGKQRRSDKCARCVKMSVFAHLSPNDLRRTFAQWLVRSGVPNELVSPLMGHKSTRMVEDVYGKRDATSVADLVELALKRAPASARTGTVKKGRRVA